MIKTDYFEVIKRFNNLDKEEWSIQNLNLPNGFIGKNLTSLVLDTGVDENHIDLSGSVQGYDFTGGKNPIDENGHGTFCTGLICSKNKKISVANGSKSISGKVLFGDARDARLNFERSISNAISFGIENKVDCISMSIGFPRRIESIEKLINVATEKNIVCFAAAGNEGMVGSPYKSYPASYTNVISVAASNSRGLPTWFSTKGIGDNKLEQPEFAISSREFFYGLLPNNGYGKMIGTSMSTPVLAASFLVWKEMIFDGELKEKNMLEEFRVWLKSKSTNNSNYKWNQYLGWGTFRF